MPEPVRGDQRYLPGLDGLRALAVAAVVAYHLGYGWAQGGLLGVGVFFTLSGYLITDILVGQWAARGRIRLGDFWLRRARRLLPALFVMLAVVTVWVERVRPAFRGRIPRERRGLRVLREQLVVHRPALLVLRAVRPAGPARSSLVPRRRGTVLPGMALGCAAARVARGAAAQARTRAGRRARGARHSGRRLQRSTVPDQAVPVGARRGDARTRRLLRCRDGPSLPAGL